jgi:triacylglycerol lipase
MNIVLVHGIFDSGSIFKKLEKKLTKRGHRCFTPSLQPNDARHGIADLAEKLHFLVNEAFGSNEPIVIIGFSMGCLISRYYLARLDAFRRTKAFFAISGPHRGSLLAFLYPGKGFRDMRPRSNFLRDLDSINTSEWDFPIYTYWTPLDLMILPASSSRWKSATEEVVWALLHRLMPSDGKVCSSIIGKIG